MTPGAVEMTNWDDWRSLDGNAAFCGSAYRAGTGCLIIALIARGRSGELHREKCYFPIGESASRRSNMMSLNSKRGLLEVVGPRYLKVNKLEKQIMLDGFTSATGYRRKYAIPVLKNRVQKQPERKIKGYKTIYRGEVMRTLEQIWESYGHLRSNCLQPFLPKLFECWNVARKSSFPKTPKNCSPWHRPPGQV